MASGARMGSAGAGERLGLASGSPVWALVGLPLLILGVGAVLISTAFDKPQTAKRLGSNLPINQGADDPADISSHNSPTLVRNPRNAANLAVTNRIDTPRYGCALHVSQNGGQSWSQQPLPAPAGEQACFAPDVAFAADGTMHLAFVTLRGRANSPNAAWVATSTDGGRTISEPTKVLGGLPFQVRIATDPADPKRLYLTWLKASEVALFKFTEPGNPIRAIRSDDGGATWGRSTRVSDAARQRAIAPTPVVGPGGQLYVLYLDLGESQLDYSGAHKGRGGPPDAGPWKLVLARSGDRGEAWTENVVEEELVPSERFIAFTPPFPSLAVDGASGRVYAGFHDGRLGDQDVWVWSLARGASAWEGPTRVNDTARRDKTSQYLPKLAVAPDGRLDVLYYDRRGDSRNERTGVSLQSSADEGKSFKASVSATNRAFDSGIGFGSERELPDLGSRLGLVATDERAFAVWTDTRAGTRASNKQDLARAVVAFSDPSRISKGAESALRYGGLALALAGLVVLGLWASGGGLANLRDRRRGV